MQGGDKLAWKALEHALSLWEQLRPRGLRYVPPGGSLERATELVYQAAESVADPLLEVTFGLEWADLILARKPVEPESWEQVKARLEKLRVRAQEAGLKRLEGQCCRRLLTCQLAHGTLSNAERYVAHWEAILEPDSSPALRAEVEGWRVFLQALNRPSWEPDWTHLSFVRARLQRENQCGLEARFLRLEAGLRLQRGNLAVAYECLREARALLQSIEDAEGIAWVAMEECLLLELRLKPWQAWQAARESRSYERRALSPVELEELRQFNRRWPLWRVLWMAMIISMGVGGRKALSGGREAQR